MYMTKYDVFCTVVENWINNITILTTENYIGAIKAFSMEPHIAVVTLDCFLIFQAAFRAHTARILHWARFSELLPDSSIRQEAVSVKFTKWQKNLSFQTCWQNRSLAGHSRQISSHMAFLTRFQRDQNQIRLSPGFHRWIRGLKIQHKC